MKTLINTICTIAIAGLTLLSAISFFYIADNFCYLCGCGGCGCFVRASFCESEDKMKQVKDFIKTDALHFFESNEEIKDSLIPLFDLLEAHVQESDKLNRRAIRSNDLADIRSAQWLTAKIDGILAAVSLIKSGHDWVFEDILTIPNFQDGYLK